MSRMTPELYRQIEQMLAEGHPRPVIVGELGVSLRMVSKVSNGGYYNRGMRPIGSVKRAAMALAGPRKSGGLNRHPDPTPDEIDAACQSLRRARIDETAADGWLPPGVCRSLSAVR